MTSLFVVLVVLMCAITAIMSNKEHRLVLHSDTDVVMELNKLRTELNDQRNEMKNLSANLLDKDSEITVLRITQSKQETEIKNLSSIINAKEAEISSLKVIQNKQNAEITSLTVIQNKQDAEIKNISLTMDHKLAVKESEILALKTAQQQVVKNITSIIQTSSKGSTYVRWGRFGCPGNGTSLAYSGYMASGKYTDPGGASNYLCLSGQPTWDYYEDNVAGYAFVYGVEYQFTAHSAAGREKFFGTDIYNDDAPCAVCHTSRATNIMIPGRNTCYDGWTKEYSGYIVTENLGNAHQTEYVCLDRRPDVVVGGKTDDNESLLHLVSGKCGKSLECPPYVNGRELSCVVCSI